MKISQLIIPGLILCLAMTLAPEFVSAQDAEDSEAPELSIWRGGQLNFDFNMNFNLLGVGSGTSMMGGVMSTRVQNGAAAVSINPAELGLMQNRQFIMDGQLGYGTSTLGALGMDLNQTISDEIQTETDGIIRDPDLFTLMPGAYTSYTEVNSFNAGIASRIGSFALAWPLHERLVLGVAASYPASMDFRLQTSGISAKLAEEQGTDDVSVRFDVLMNISMLMHMTFQMNTLSFGLGSELYDGRYGSVSLGASMHRYQVENKRTLNTDLSGMVVVGNADERFFNNPADPNLNFEAGETNSFFMQANGLFKDDGYGFQFGTIYKAPKIATLSVVYQHMPTFELRDENARGVAFLPVFLVGDDVLGGDLEVQLDTLQANKPNLTTEREISDLVKDATLKLPSSLRFGVDLAAGKQTFALNYAYYFDEFNFQYGNTSYGKDAQHGLGFGVNLTFPDRLRGGAFALIPVRLLFLDFDGILFQSLRKYTGYSNPQYSLGTSVMLGEALEDSSDMMGLPLPTGFSLGRRYTLRDQFLVGMSFISHPDLLFRFSLGYTF